MQTKNNWLSNLFRLLKDSPKVKTDLLDVLKSGVHEGLLDNESLKMKSIRDINTIHETDFEIVDYNYYPTIKADMIA